MEMYRKSYAEINLDHLAHNLNQIRSAFPQVFMCPMVKANAYGHGDIQVARCLELLGTKHLGVCLIEEGLLLKRFGIRCEILVFRGFDMEGARVILENNMIPVVSTWNQLEYLDQASDGKVPVHIKFDTGMNRLGFPVGEASRLVEYFNTHKKFNLQGVLTHLSQGEDAWKEDGYSKQQIEKFETVRKIFAPLVSNFHALNSAGIISAAKIRKEGQSTHYLSTNSWGLRPGLMLYGYNPIAPGFTMDLKPVMNLKSVVGGFRQLQRGEGVSYNSTWKAPRESVIAVVPLGYADGYHRILSNNSEALFLGQRVPVIGNICMDYLMLDVTEVAKKKSFDVHCEHEVVLLGSDSEGASITAYELAQKSRTIPWEVLTSVGERIPRIYTGELSHKFENKGLDL